MSGIDIEIRNEIEKMIDNETERLVIYYTDELRKYIQSHINSATRKFKNVFNVNPIVETRVEADRIIITYEIPPQEISRIREAVRKKLMEQTTQTRLRIKALARLISYELEFVSGEVNSLLSDMHTSSTEGHDQTGGTGGQIWHEEGGYSSQSTDESNSGGGALE